MTTALQKKATASQAAADVFPASDISDAAIAARRQASLDAAAAVNETAGGLATTDDPGTIARLAAEMAEDLVGDRVATALEAYKAANPPAAAPVPSLADTTVLGLPLGDVVTFLGMIAGAVVPGASLAGFTIAQLTNLGVGVAKEIPEAVTAFEEIKALAESGAEPTAEQWAAWNAAADAANAAASAAEDEVIKGAGQ